MKKSLPFLSVMVILFGCASDNDLKNTDTETTEVKSENPVGIQNVNGNIPDTINTIDIGTHKKDTNLVTRTDSAK